MKSPAFAQAYKSAEKKSDFLQSIMQKVDFAKTTVDPEQYLQERFPAVLDIFNEFNNSLMSSSQILFSDMVQYAHKLLKHNGILAQSLHDVYDHILVDEFQDTNEVQNAVLLILAAHGQVSVVGDSDQV
jgi:ATP-dependent exoDNAse (exonuclease V) beta subunit